MEISILEYIKPELLILIPVLYLLGYFMKKSSTIKDNMIPIILGITSILLCTIWIFGNVQNDFVNCLFAGITQGILCAGVAVYGSQIYIQSKKGDDSSNDKEDNSK